MIVVTGALGFIGSCLITKLNEKRFFRIIAVDDFSKVEKERNLYGKTYQKIERSNFVNWLRKNPKHIECVFHLGARTDTSCQDINLLNSLNLNYTKVLWSICTDNQIPFIYASSAATYGDGQHGYNDEPETIIDQLIPLNPYAQSKNEFDKWAIRQDKQPYFWVGLKFFNVFGPNEYHKKTMASVIYHAYNQIKKKGYVKLFRSHRTDFKDGEQKRDFIYVKDVIEILLFFMHYRKQSGIYNLGTGQATTFIELVQVIFCSLNLPQKIKFIDIPENIRASYQYFTQANMNKLLKLYPYKFTSIHESVNDYIKCLEIK